MGFSKSNSMSFLVKATKLKLIWTFGKHLLHFQQFEKKLK
ncbi:hypothetical protein C900_00001 [Fulvivirga imtechensis AK7]|uniref:Uncharacterized protein n=1 Tax=Fulvivirga imtechensis AK7 TaxID=1237149 RepID=L8K302_9BACT|nr:hypothetical protein C900_00001 [Fulvivirga imtechensis AK7]